MRGLLLTIIAGALLAPAADAQAARPLTIGFFDNAFATPGAGPARLDQARSVGAQLVRVGVGWPAARRPAAPGNPADPAYDFSAADAAIESAASRGLRVLASFTGAPAWAEGAHRLRSAPPGTWRPSPAALRGYGAALARRYDGTYPDPLHPGRALPRIRYFQLWNEPNLSTYLTPQWSGSHNVAPVLYRRMLNAFYAGVRGAQPGAKVVTAGTAPFGDPGHGRRTMPLRFWRTAMAAPIHFDVLAHHPYSVGGPTRHALNADDISIPDMGKLRRLLARERHRGTVDGPKPLWVTEVAYDSSPPDPQGVPIARHARWLEQTFFLLWRQHVSTVLWFEVQDSPPYPSYAATNQGGVFYLDGRAKPAARAFRFPLVATRHEVWARAPLAGRMLLQRLASGRWKTLRSVTVRAGATVDVGARLRRGDLVRGRLGSLSTLSWKVS